MIIKEIKIFSQNMQKNNLIVNTILETQFYFDIIFIQEPSWTTICLILSSRSKEGEELVRVLNHPNWITFSRNPSKANSSPRIIIYINIRLLSFHFSLCKDIYNHRDISSPMSSYPSQITLYRSLHAHWQLILEFTIQEFHIWVSHWL